MISGQPTANPSLTTAPSAYERIEIRRNDRTIEIGADILIEMGLLDDTIRSNPGLRSVMKEVKSDSSPEIIAKANRAILNSDLLGARIRDPKTGRNSYALVRRLHGTTVDKGFSVIPYDVVTKTRGREYLPPEFSSPLPIDANDPSYARQGGLSRTPDATRLKVTNNPETDPWVRFNAMARVGAFYDKAAPPAANTNFAQGVSLAAGSDPRAGQTTFFQAGGDSITDLDLIFASTILTTEDATVDLVADVNNDAQIDQLDTKYLGGYANFSADSRSRFAGWALGLGKLPSLFSQTAYTPANLRAAETFIGSGDRGNDARAQLSLSIPVTYRSQLRLGIEEPGIGDVAVLATNNLAATLTRLPTFAANLEIGDDQSFSSLRIGSIFRSLGYQDTLGAEHFDAGYGLSAAGRIGNRNWRFLYGFSGGNGVGDFIVGVPNSSFIGVSQLTTLKSYGSFIGLQKVLGDADGNLYSALNVAYGYSWMETPDILGADVDQKLQQGVVNYLRVINEYVSIGVQYEFGFREVASGSSADNNRFLFTVALKPGKNLAPNVAQLLGQSQAMIDGGMKEVQGFSGSRFQEPAQFGAPPTRRRF